MSTEHDPTEEIIRVELPPGLRHLGEPKVMRVVVGEPRRQEPKVMQIRVVSEAHQEPKVVQLQYRVVEADVPEPKGTL
jgi:hypothetical protein